MDANHIWTVSDDLAALYVYKFGTENIPYDRREISERKHIKIGSFRMRIEDFRALDGEGGLTHYSKQSKAVWDHYNNLTETDLRRIAFPEL